MPNADTIKIPLKRQTFLKAIWLCGLCILLIGLAIKQNDNIPAFLVYLKNFILVAGALMYGTGILLLLSVMLKKSGGLFINKIGIQDNTSGTAVGLIHWNDIERVEIFRQYFLTIYLKNPEVYIAREANPLKRMLMRKNLKHYGSPSHISVRNVKSSPAELKQLISSRLDSNNII